MLWFKGKRDDHLNMLYKWFKFMHCNPPLIIFYQEYILTDEGGPDVDLVTIIIIVSTICKYFQLSSLLDRCNFVMAL